MQARPRHQRGQALHELQRRHHNVRGAVAPGALELQHDVTRAMALEPFVGDRRTRDVAAQPFEFLALMQPDVRERLTTLGVEVVGSTPAQLGEAVAAEVRKWAQLVRERNLRFD